MRLADNLSALGGGATAARKAIRAIAGLMVWAASSPSGAGVANASEEARRETRAPDRAENALVAFAAEEHVALGMSRREVEAGMLGPPDDIFATDVWIYWNVKPRGRPPGEGLTTLLVVFVADRVTRIFLADAQETRTRLARLRAAARTTPP